MIAGQLYTWNEVVELLKKAGGADWNTIANKPAFIAVGSTAVEARTAIGAGTSNLAIGTTGTTAMAGNSKPATAGAADTAAALVTGRTFTLTGGATGTSAAFTGAANASIPVVLATPAGAVRGGVLIQPAIPNLIADPTMADHNALLAALRLSGVLTT